MLMHLVLMRGRSDGIEPNYRRRARALAIGAQTVGVAALDGRMTKKTQAKVAAHAVEFGWTSAERSDANAS